MCAISQSTQTYDVPNRNACLLCVQPRLAPSPPFLLFRPATRRPQSDAMLTRLLSGQRTRIFHDAVDCPLLGLGQTLHSWHAFLWMDVLREAASEVDGLRACRGFDRLEHVGRVHDDSSANLHETPNQLTSSFVKDCLLVLRTLHPVVKATLVDDLICVGPTIDRNTKQGHVFILGLCSHTWTKPD